MIKKYEKKLGKVDSWRDFSPFFLRVGIAFVFLWFGFSQIKNPSAWTRMVPDYVLSMSPFSVETLIYFNGTFEIVFAFFLLLGLYTRITSLLLGLHLLHITTIVGYGPVGARDLALAIATFAIFLHGADRFCFDRLWKIKEPVLGEISKDEKSSEMGKKGEVSFSGGEKLEETNKEN